MVKLKFRTTLTAVSFFTALVSTTFFSGSIPLVTLARAKPIFVPSVQQQGFADVVSQVKPAVVSVRVKGDERVEERSFSGFFSGPGLDLLPDQHPLKRFFQDFYDRDRSKNYSSRSRRKLQPVAFGSGFFISSNGYIVTNHHVISIGKSYSVVLDDGTELTARLVGTDSRTDLAVLKVNDKQMFPYVDFADDSKLKVGDWVVAVGNPFGLGGTVTAGIVSARGRDIGAGTYDDFIQIDAAVNKGNSGGPTFNLNGQVVGVNTAIFSPSSEGGNVGIAFAIPATVAKQVVNQLIEKGSVQRGWLGVQIQSVTKEVADSIGLKEAKGVLVTDPLKGPAEKAGVKTGDVIVSINGEKISDVRDLARRVANMKPGDTVVLRVWRSGKEENIKVKLDPMPADEKESSKYPSGKSDTDRTLADYGLVLVLADDGQGLVVTDVDPDSEAADKGIRPGDVIMTINNKPVRKVSDITDTIKDAQSQGRVAVLLQVRTNDQNRFVALSIVKK